MEGIKIMVDFREPEDKVAKLKTVLGERAVEVVVSEVGDYFTPDRKVGIERKSLHDYLDSMTGRLKQQLKELFYSFPCLRYFPWFKRNFICRKN